MGKKDSNAVIMRKGDRWTVVPLRWLTNDAVATIKAQAGIGLVRPPRGPVCAFLSRGVRAGLHCYRSEPGPELAPQSEKLSALGSIRVRIGSVTGSTRLKHRGEHATPHTPCRCHCSAVFCLFNCPDKEGGPTASGRLPLHHRGRQAGRSRIGVRAAVTASTKSTARITEQIEISGGDTPVALSIKGSFDMARDKGRLAVSLGSSSPSPADRPPVPLDEIFTNGTVYVRMPEERSGDSSCRSIRRDRAEAHYLLHAPVNDPEHVLRQVARMHSVSKVGQETVNGTSAVHYRGKLDQETLMLRMAGDRRAKMATLREKMGREIPASADVWINRDGRIVRTRLDCPLGPAGVTVTMNLQDIGKPVSPPTAPKAAEAMPTSAMSGILTG
ncbi:hypothetical protein [Streptomyces luteireticuli]|uniref:Uncharacterized protein n=1 Tax=Streptomyces luteireticuli TaxID=173858 RepID=A0ABN0YYA3_9ACTN